eukprot:301831_1
MATRCKLIVRSVGPYFNRHRLFTTISEKWAKIDGFSLYQVSSLGNVKNIKLKKVRNINVERYRKLKSAPQCRLKSDNGELKSFSISRLVLNSFKPMSNSHKLFAIHIDGNKFNNQLSNLTWSNKIFKHTSQVHKPKEAIELQCVTTDDNLRFDSQLMCANYFNVSNASISKWCYEKKIMHGYKFMFADEAKYIKTIPDLNGEKWKMYYQSTKHKGKFYISSFGRSKKVSLTGKERLHKQNKQNGYLVLSTQNGQTAMVSRLVAKHFLDNPGSYPMVDHIDGNTYNNHVSNLRWVKNHQENANNPISLQRFSEAKQNKKRIEQLTLNGCVLKVWERPIFVKRQLGYHTGHILAVCSGKQKTAYGYKWRFHNA